MPHIVACIDVYEDMVVKETIKRFAPTGWEVRMASSYDEKHQRTLIDGADIILAGWAPIPAWMFESPTLLFVQKFGVGYDKIDTVAARKMGVGVAIANGMNAVPVAELVLLFILALYRKFRYLDTTIRAGKWVKSEMRSKAYSLQGKTVGIVGLGFIGREVAKRVQAFNANVIYYDKFRRKPEEEAAAKVQYMDLDDLVAEADVVTLHMPSTAETRGLFDAKRLSEMKPTSLLINTARGELVVANDLIAALRSGKLMGAALDVYETEPLDPNSELFSLENLILTPHIGGTVLDNVAVMARHCFKNIELFLAGEPLPSGDTIVAGTRLARK